jgi:hypothetical protein
VLRSIALTPTTEDSSVVQTSSASRHGHQRGTATLAGQKIPIDRPRVRRTDGGGEVPLETYARLQSPEAMPAAVLRRMIRGVSTREYANVIDHTWAGFGVQKSSVSRDLVRASAAQVKALAERRFDGTRFPMIMIDGVEYAGATMIVAAGITANGTKSVLGLRQGATENATVCVWRCWRICRRGAWTRANPCSWCWPRPGRRRRGRPGRSSGAGSLAHSSEARGRLAALVGCPTRTLAPPLVFLRADPSHPRHAVISCRTALGRRGSRQTGSWPSLPCRPAT